MKWTHMANRCIVVMVSSMLCLAGCSDQGNGDQAKVNAELELAKAELARLQAEAKVIKAQSEADQAKSELARLKAKSDDQKKQPTKSTPNSTPRSAASTIAKGKPINPPVPLTFKGMVSVAPYGGAIYRYSQSTGEFIIETTKGSQRLCYGYSGEGTARNNPAMQQQVNGPIPRGRYTLGKLLAKNTWSKKADILTLMPEKGVETFGRRPGMFLIVPSGVWRGDQYTAAIVVPQQVWDCILFHGQCVVEVVR